ncbi:hypothetical protein BJX64DRAFT_293126 [Aspergillus heterothallicus]
MDPGTIIAVAQLAGSLALTLGRYIKRAKGAKDEVLTLQKKTQVLQKTLEDLAGLLQNGDNSRLATLKGVSDDIQECQTTLTSFQQRLETKKSKLKEMFGTDNLKWPFQSGDFKSLIGEIDDYQKRFIHALKIDQTKITLTIDEKLELDRLKIAEGAAFDSHTNQDDRCLPGTRVDVIREIEDWAESPNGEGIYWVRGKAGTGKSTISRTIASFLHGKGVLGGSFFFKRGEAERGNGRRLFPTLAKQLANSPVTREMRPGILKALRDTPDISDKNLQDQFESLILQPLLAIQEGVPIVVTIVIDALDECDQSRDIRTILGLLSEVKSSAILQLRFVLTSRFEEPIVASFKSISRNGHDYRELILDEKGRTAIQDDIALFFEKKLKIIREERDLAPNWPGKEQVQALVKMSTPLFVFAATVCRMLEDDQFIPKATLEAILSYQYGNTELERTYLPVFEQLLKDRTKAQQGMLIREYRALLGTIIALEAPLSASSLSKLTEIPIENIKIRLNSLHSVLSVPDGNEEPALLDRQKTDTSRIDGKMHETYEIPFEKKHPTLTKNVRPARCLTICLSLSVVQFFEEHFLHWLEAMGRLGQTTEGQHMIHELQAVIQAKQHQVASEYFEDVRRFILSNREIVEADPSQLYSSALIFAPRDSNVRKAFSGHLSGWSLLPVVPETWGSTQLTFRAHQNEILMLAFSPTGNLLASGSQDSTVRLWNAATGECVYTLNGHIGTVVCIAFSPDGSKLASGGADESLKLWDPVEGRLIWTLAEQNGTVTSVAFSSDNLTLATTSRGGVIRLRTPADGSVMHELRGDDPHHFPRVAFSPVGHKLASTTMKGIEIWNVKDQSLERVLEHDRISLLFEYPSVTFSPNGELLACSWSGGCIKIWDSTSSLRDKIELKLGGTSLVCPLLAFLPDSRLLASGLNISTVGIWDVAAGETCRTFGPHSGPVTSLTCAPDGRLLASGDMVGVIKICDIAADVLYPAVEGLFEESSHIVSDIALTPDGRLMAYSTEDTITMVDPLDGKVRTTLTGPRKVLSLSFSPDGQHLASAWDDDTIRLWDLATDQEPKMLIDCSLPSPYVVFSSDGRLLASCSWDGTVRLWDPIRGSLVRLIDSGVDNILCIALSPDGDFIALGNVFGDLQVQHLITEGRKWRYKASLLTRGLSFSPDGLQLSVSDGKLTKIWDTIENDFQQTLEGYTFHTWVDDNDRVSIFQEEWICINGKKKLWLPLEYRPRLLVAANGILALVTGTEKVFCLSLNNIRAL